MSNDTDTTTAPARKGGRKPTITTNKTDLRRLIGQKGRAVPFTAADLAAATEVTTVTARNHIERLVEAGKVERAGKRETGNRGRPAHLFTVAKGK